MEETVCSFCKMNCLRSESLWTHMVQCHAKDGNKWLRILHPTKSLTDAGESILQIDSERPTTSAKFLSSLGKESSSIILNGCYSPHTPSCSPKGDSDSKAQWNRQMCDSAVNTHKLIMDGQPAKTCGSVFQDILPQVNLRFDDSSLGNDLALNTTDPRTLRCRRREQRKESAGPVMKSKKKRFCVRATTTNGETTDTSNSALTDTTCDTNTKEMRGSWFNRVFMNEFDDQFLENFIALYQQNPCLWNQTSKAYRSRKLKSTAYNALLAMYSRETGSAKVDVKQIQSFIRRLERRYKSLQRPNVNPYRSHIWQRLAFIESGLLPEKFTRIQRRRLKQSSKKYYCTECHRQLKHSKAYKDHMLKYHPSTECTNCKQKFANADELKHHLMVNHERDQQCPLCKQTDVNWKTSLHLARHFYDHVCSICSKIFHDTLNYKQHRSECRLRCLHCGAVFSASLDLRRHARLKHQEPEPFKCETCELQFKFMSQLLRHRKEHQFP